MPEPDPADLERVGGVELEEESWNLLFRETPEARVETLVALAEHEAKQRYGSGATLGTIRVRYQWNPLSLLMLFGSLGAVEDGSVEAVVYRPAPPPPPEPAPVEKAMEIRYPIDPDDRYREKNGYIGIEYRRPEEIAKELQKKHEEGTYTAEELDEELSEIPGGGVILVHIGRQDLLHANTRWYSYLVEDPDSVRIEREGEEGIPNVRGRDGNWWNVVELPLEEPIDTKVDVAVFDNRARSEYHFTIRREENALVN